MTEKKMIGIRADEVTQEVWKEVVRREKRYGKFAWAVFREMLILYLRKKGYWQLLKRLEGSKAIQL